MIYRTSDGPARGLALFFLLLTAAFIILSAFQSQHHDSDIFWALKSGEWIFSHHRVPLTDPFSYTFSDARWIDFTWGFQVIAHLFYAFSGAWKGLFVLQVLLTALVFVFLALNLRGLAPERPLLSGSMVMLVFTNLFPRLFIRPHLFAFLFITLYFLILEPGGKRKKPVYILLLLPLQVLWINIHSSAVLGIFIVMAYTAGEIIDTLRTGGFRSIARPSAELKWLVAASILLPVASLINPYGLKLVIFPFVHQSGENVDALRHIKEWTALPARQLFFSLYPWPINVFAFRVLFYLSLLALFVNRGFLRTCDLIIFPVAAYMAASHARWVGLFGLFVAPLITRNTAAWLGRMRRPSLPVGVITAVGLLTAFLMATVFFGHNYRENMYIGADGRSFPTGTVAYMKKMKKSGNLYNDYIFGGYLIFNDIKVFIDGRTPTVYSPAFFWKTRLAGSKKRWKRLEKEYDLGMALVRPASALCRHLYENPRWRPVMFDDVSVLFVRSEAGGLTVDPCTDKKKYKLPDEKEKLKKQRDELKGVISTLEADRPLYSRPHRLLGLVYMALGGKDNLNEAAREFRKALLVKRSAYIYYDLGISERKLKNYEKAAESFRAALSLDGDFSKARLGLGLSLFDMEDYEAAAGVLESFIREADDRAGFSAYMTFGKALFNLSRYSDAERALRRAAFLADSEKDLAEAYYYLGNALVEEGRQDEGLRYWRLAIEGRPAYRKVFAELSKQLRGGGRTALSRRIQALLNSSVTRKGPQGVQRSHKMSL